MTGPSTARPVLTFTLRELVAMAAAAELAAGLPEETGRAWLVGANRTAMIAGARKITGLALELRGSAA